MLSNSTPWYQWLAGNWGDIATLAGLMVSLWVLVVSRRARRAAIEARDAVFRRNVVDDLRRFSDEISFLGSLVDTRSWSVASSVSTRLLQSLHFFAGRWDGVLGSESRRSVNGLIVQIGTVRTQLVRFVSKPPSEDELASLSGSLSKVGSTLSRQVGRYESKVHETSTEERQ